MQMPIFFHAPDVGGVLAWNKMEIDHTAFNSYTYNVSDSQPSDYKIQDDLKFLLGR